MARGHVEAVESRTLFAAGAFANAAEVDVAYDAAGTLHMAYYDSAEHVLKYASRGVDGVWSSAVTVDAAGGDVGRTPAIAVDREGVPGIAYRDEARTDLKYARLGGSGWVTEFVDRFKDSGQYPDLAYDGGNRPVVSYFRNTGDKVMVGQFNGRKWAVKAVDSVGKTADGRSSLAIDPGTGMWAVAYERADRAIRLTEQTSARGRTRSVTVATLNRAGGGGMPSLAFDAAGRPAVAFYDGASSSIVLATPAGRAYSRTVVATGAAANAESELSFDPVTGRPAVAYYDAGMGGVVVAEAGEEGGVFTATLVRATDGTGGLVVAREPDGAIVVTDVDPEGEIDVDVDLPAVGGLGVTLEGGSATVTWTDAVSDGMPHRHVVQRAAGVGAGFVDVADLSAGATSYVDAGLAEGVTYIYRVRTVTGAGNAAVSDQVSVTTGLTGPAGVTARAGTGLVVLGWVDRSGGEGAYVPERSSDGVNFAPLTVLQANFNAYVDVPVEEGRTYHYRVRATAVDGGNPSEYSETVTVTTPLRGPTGLVATAVNSGRVELTWVDNSGAETGYVVERGTSEEGPFVGIAEVPAGSQGYADTAVQDGVGYYYRVRAVSGVTGAVSAAAGAGPVVPPAPEVVAATNLAATGVGANSVALAWQDNESRETAYVVERAGVGGEFSTVATLAAGATSYSDGTVAEGTRYRYRVRTVAETGSAVSGVLTVDTALVAPTNVSATVVSHFQVDLAWSDLSGREAGYAIERSTDGVTFGPLITVAANVQAFTDVTAVEGQQYFYRVRAVAGDIGAASAFATSASVATPVIAAFELDFTTTTANSISLSWFDASNRETGYAVDRSADNGVSFTQIATLAAGSEPFGVMTYTDAGRPEATAYLYRVRTLSAVGPEASTNYLLAATRPVAPTNLTAELQGSYAYLTWADNSQAEMGYTVRVSADGGETYSVVNAFLDEDATSFTVEHLADFSPLVAGRSYLFTVEANFLLGNSAASNAAGVTLPLNAPYIFYPTPVGGAVSLEWTDAGGEAGYAVYRRAEGGDEFELIDSVDADVNEYLDEGLPEGAVFSYKVVALGEDDVAAVEGNVVETYTLLKPATNFSGTPVGDDRVEFTWTDNSDVETGYVVFADAGYVIINYPGSVAPGVNAFTWTGLDLATEYHFYVVALGTPVNGDIPTHSEPSNEYVLETPAGPSRLTANVTGVGDVALSWQDFPQTGSGFEIERSMDGENWVPLDTVAANFTLYTDTTVEHGTEYYYRVRYAGAARYSAPAVVYTDLATPTGFVAVATSPTSVHFSWDAAPGEQDFFHVEFSVDGYFWYPFDAVAGDVYELDVTELGFGLGAIQPGETYKFRLGRTREVEGWGTVGAFPTEVVEVTMPGV